MYTPSAQTPIGLLQEICTRKGLIIHYEMIANEGEAHEPLYVYQCNVGKYTGIGKGSSKKKAKHLASYHTLHQLLNDGKPTPSEKSLLQAVRLSLPSLGIEIDDLGAPSGCTNSSAMRTQLNYVGKVHDYCEKNFWPPPTYEFKECPPSLFGGNYICKIRLWKWEFTGLAASKKEAKRKAAIDFYNSVVEKGLTIPSEDLTALEEANLPLVEKQDLNKLRVKQSAEETASRLAKKVLSGVYTSNGRLPPIDVDELKSPELVVYEALKRILDERNLTVFYSYTTNTKSGKIYCQAQLSTQPPQVACSRACPNIDEARLGASYRCLVFLDTMTKRRPVLDERAWFRTPLC